MSEKIIVTVQGDGRKEKAQAVKDGIEMMLRDNNIINVRVELEKEIQVPSFVNQPYYMERRNLIG